VRAAGEVVALRDRPAPLPPRLSTDEYGAHRRFIESLGDNAIWRDYVSRD